MYTLLIVSLVVLSTERVHVQALKEEVRGLTKAECYAAMEEIRKMGPTKQAQCAPERK